MQAESEDVLGGSREPDGPVDGRRGESFLYRLRFALLVLLPLLAGFTGAIWVQSQSRVVGTVDLAAGSRSGTYFPLGEGFRDALAQGSDGIPARVQETDGSVDNMQRLAEKTVNFAFVQNNTDGDTHVRTVARLYPEVLQVVVRRDLPVQRLQDLQGLRVSIGPNESGTHQVMQSLIDHFGLPRAGFEAMTQGEAQAEFQAGKLDAAVFLAGLPTDAVAQLLRTGKARLLSLGRSDETGSSLQGLAANLPGMVPADIPAWTYGELPESTVGSLAVQALLVTRADVPDPLVQEVTRRLFASRFALIKKHPAAAEMTEIQGSRGLRFPLHPGAADYYRRNEPPFFVTYAEVLSLALTFLLTLGSGILAVREWARRVKKNRIDVYYLEVDQVAQGLVRESPEEELREARRKLFRLRKQAFHDLVAERINANQSFSIFQAFLDTQLFEIDRRLHRLRSG